MTASRVLVQLDEVTNSCFVVMPFHPLFGEQYDKVLRPAIESAGLVCVRGDEIYAKQSIIQDIWESIRHCRLVVAELSGRNPNVMYEIGLAHAIGKPIVLLTRNEADVPFDLLALRYIRYDTSDPFWGTNLQTQITRVLKLILENPTLAAHLHGVKIETQLPDAPTRSITSERLDVVVPDLSGVWQGKWLSIQREREHRATIVIPTDHNSTFSASMTVTYERFEKQTIVEETLTATITEHALSLIGVNYTYVQQGASSSYSLDKFDLRLSDDGAALSGKVILKHGMRDVSFQRIPSALL